MRLRVFRADKGDSLLLTSDDRKNVLIDGGPKAATFDDCTLPSLLKFADQDPAEQLDLVMVSHIDEDHILGVLHLVERYVEWIKHDFAIDPDGGDMPDSPPPLFDRPPPIGEMWHNSWIQHIGGLASKVSAVVTNAAESIQNDANALAGVERREQVIEAINWLAQSIGQASDLQDIVDTTPSPIERNKDFADNLITLTEPPITRELGSLRFTVLGPTQERLDILREFWREKLGLGPQLAGPGLAADADGVAEAVVLDAVDAQAAGIVLVESLAVELAAGGIGDVSEVTEANRASIVVLAEEGEPDSDEHRSCLLTGDTTQKELLEGLNALGSALEGGSPFRCDILKVQHHGSENNFDEDFAARVLARHYVFCANGEHKNPDDRVVKALIDTRADKSNEPFTVWFNCALDDTAPRNQPALRSALNTAVEAADRANTNAGDADVVTIRVLKAGRKFFDVCLCGADADCDCKSPGSCTTRLTQAI